MSQDYNATINLPKTDFPMRAGLPKREPDMLASWYIQNYILPEHQEEERPFNPLDPGQVDICGIRTPVTP